MKNFYFLMLFLAATALNAQIVNIPDANFKAHLLSSNPWNFIGWDLSGNKCVIDTNGDGEIQLSEAQNISKLTINVGNFGNITNMTGVKSFSNLTELTVQNVFYLSSLDVSNMTNLQFLILPNNGLSSLNIQGCTSLTYMDILQNQFNNLNFLQSNTVTKLWLGLQQGLTTADLSGLPNLEVLDLQESSTYNNFTSLNLSANPNLKIVKIKKENLNSLNISGLHQLEHFELQKTKLQSLNIGLNPNLNWFAIIQNTLLTQVDLTTCNSLQTVIMVDNPLLGAVNLQNKTSLQTLSYNNNNIQTLDFTGSNNVSSIYFTGSQVNSINLSNLTNLTILQLGETSISELDLSNSSALYALTVNNNPNLTSINIKNGSPSLNLSSGSIQSTPNLKYICCDNNRINMVLNAVSGQNLSNLVINSYCSFTPGGTYYTIQGNTRYDSNNNGCDVTDPIKSFQLFNIVGNGVSGSFIGNNTGNYTIPVSAGTHTITPALENPNYFNFSPTSFTANFPSQTSPSSQNFCLTANGIHNDLEVIILPITPATPGFNAKYKIICKNKGTSTQSGTLSFTYNDNISDFVTSSITPNSQITGFLNFNISNLLPFETREILVTIHLNTPTQNPPLNGGNILHYTSQIIGLTDETPSDNTFNLNQTVVNSFDPNDKTCLQGTSIAQSQVGDFVHYLIRFENTGTANAQNIVVKDIIDINKFDINSFVALNGSHHFIARVTNANTVEFIFENIQLPFDDANNDGYVSFKIKTKSTLTTGDSFSNSAAIYFDYNAPIITNNYTTSIEQFLSTNEATGGEIFSVYPNPVIDILNFKAKEKVLKIEVYDVSGRIVSSLPATNQQADLSFLKKGNYLIKIHMNNKLVTRKILKK